MVASCKENVEASEMTVEQGCFGYFFCCLKLNISVEFINSIIKRLIGIIRVREI